MADRAQVKAMVDAVAFTIPDGYDNAGDRIVHCFSGSLGADWPLDAVLAEIDTALQIEWVPDIFGHDLSMVCADGRVRRFEVQRPD